MVLFDYSNVFSKTPEEINFGSSEEFEETLEWFFANIGGEFSESSINVNSLVVSLTHTRKLRNKSRRS